MARLQPDQIPLLKDACGANLPAAADALRECFGFENCRIDPPGEPVRLARTRVDDEFAGPGLVVRFERAGDVLAVLLPSGWLPAWYSAPDASQAKRLQVLASDWSTCLLPPELEADQCETRAVSNLRECALAASPPEWATSLEFTIALDEGGAATEQATENDGGPVARMRVVWPLVEVGDEEEDDDETDVHPFARLLPLEVPISVRVAEKSIDVGQFIALTPGALISFDKSCDDLLELYVGNQLYARGEAVKIGEKFGLKIDEIGVVNTRVSHVYEH